ncbi:MAG: R body protein RebB-like protein [Lysobacteraceae bacterium]|nr:MAG: R body protein RebB-like protein [Xanthomonadaceae bacterium]
MTEEVDKQITDAVTQSTTAVVGESPAMAMGLVYQSEAHSMGILFENAVATQQRQNTMSMAATNVGILQMYGLEPVASAGDGQKLAQTGVSDDVAMATMAELIKSIRSLS